MSYFVTIAADHHQTASKSAQGMNLLLLKASDAEVLSFRKKTQKKLIGGWHPPPPPALYVRGLTSQDYHSRVNESGFGILVAPLI